MNEISIREFDKYLKGKEVKNVEMFYQDGSEFYVVNFTDGDTKLKVEYKENNGFFIGVEKKGNIMFGTGVDVIYPDEESK